MGDMVRRAKSILGTNEFTALYDKGFHTGSELKTAQDLVLKPLLQFPNCHPQVRLRIMIITMSTSFTTKNQTHTLVRRDRFSTPMDHGTSSGQAAGSISWFKQYKTKACKKCPVRSQCTRSEKERLIQRSEFAEYYERNLINTLEKEHLYKRRQAIVEHPYGTIKRQWGFSYIITKKGMKRASSDVGFMLIAYNLRRIGNILTRDRLNGVSEDTCFVVFGCF